jgi:simple sugar transport system permease protein
VPQVQAALQVNVLFLLGAGLAPVLAWGLTHTRWGLILQTVGDSADAALALGYSVHRVRWAATALGGFLAGVGGSFLSLYYPGSWNEGCPVDRAGSSPGHFRAGSPSLLRGRFLFCGLVLWDQLQSVGITQGYYLLQCRPRMC